jgi:8-oxo-dGTP pyrophosphatase MutT (NUDIX family)
MEIWDAYKEDGSLAGCDLIRGEIIPDGLFHLVSEVIVRHTDGDFLVMQRDYNKKVYPGMFEATASGGVVKGESTEECAIRELKEETGIDGANIKFISKSVDPTTQGIYYIYLCETDCDKKSIILQEGETIYYQWMGQDEFIRFVETDQYIKADKKFKQSYLKTLK